MRLLITRTEPEASNLSDLLQKKGHTTYVEPLLRVNYHQVTAPKDPFQALVVTSSHALYGLQKNWKTWQNCQDGPNLSGLPLFTVGETTAKLAKTLQHKCNFNPIYQGSGTAEGLIDTILSHARAGHDPVLHLAGAELAYDMAADLSSHDITLKKLVIYETNPLKKLSLNIKNIIKNKDLDAILLMSPKTARIWARLVKHDALYSYIEDVKIFCLSQKVAKPLSDLGKLPVKIASAPSRDAFIELIDANS